MSAEHEQIIRAVESIRKIDEEAFYRLINITNNNISYMMAANVLDALVQPRCMDSAPDLGFRKNTGVQSGCKEVFKLKYNSTEVDGEDVIGTVRIGDKVQVPCDISVLKTLKALIRTGICNNEDLANACRNLFQLIITCKEGGMVTKNDMLEVITERKDYYENNLAEVITELHS